MKKYPKLSYPNDTETNGIFDDGTVYITEKLDGGNGRFTLERNIEDEYHTDERDIVFGSRNVVYKNKSDETKQFADPMQYVRENVFLDQLRHYDEEYGGLVIFGEFMEPHTIQEYDWDKWKGTFVGFDVWSIEESRFLPPKNTYTIFDAIGIPTAPLLAEVDVDDWNDGQTQFHTDDGEWPEDESWCPTSAFGDVKAEGLVLKNPTTDVYAKLVRSSFKETNDKTFNSKPSEPSGHEKLLYNYVTNARIRKAVHRMIDEGDWNEPQMEMMADGLPREVIVDMIDEEGENIFMGENYTVDLSDFRSDLSGRCATVLRKMVNENIENNL